MNHRKTTWAMPLLYLPDSSFKSSWIKRAARTQIVHKNRFINGASMTNSNWNYRDVKFFNLNMCLYLDACKKIVEAKALFNLIFLELIIE